jgi:hypothetical protein
MIWWDEFNNFSFTPKTIVASMSLPAGAEITTLFAPARM